MIPKSKVSCELNRLRKMRCGSSWRMFLWRANDNNKISVLGAARYNVFNVKVKFSKHNEGELWTPDLKMGILPVVVVGLPTAHHIGLLRPNTFVNTILTSLCPFIL